MDLILKTLMQLLILVYLKMQLIIYIGQDDAEEMALRQSVRQ